MSKSSRNDGLEKQLKSIYEAPAAGKKFSRALEAQLNDRVEEELRRSRRPWLLRPASLALTGVLLALLIAFFAIGPSKVYAKVRELLGYIPGVGLVDTSNPIRVLAEPVELTRDGVTITVTSAVLTADRTHIEYRVFGVPRSAYPDSEDISGCMQQEFIMLADGTKLMRTSDYPAIPADVDEAYLVIPCIGNTLPGSVPETWILPLKFVVAPEGYTVLPVIEVTPSPLATVLNGTSTPVADNALSITKVIATDNGYILIGKFAPTVEAGNWVQTTGNAQITDAAGKDVPYSMQYDVLPGENISGGGYEWAYKFNNTGVAYPITITFKGVKLISADPAATASIEFDTGPDPQPGQTWQVNQQAVIAGHTVTLKTVSADSRQGYSFNFEVDTQVYSVGVAIEGYNSVGGGGGGNMVGGGSYSVSLAYTKLPSGKLKVVLSNLTLVSDPITWQTTWSPEQMGMATPVVTGLPVGVCVDASTIVGLPAIPSNLSGKVLMYEQLENSDKWGLVLYNLDGSGKTNVAADANWADVSRDGTKVVYSAPGGFQIYDLATGQTKTLSTADGYNPRWSPDGNQVAYIGGAAAGVFIVDATSDQVRQVSSAGYESVIGWSADGSVLYIGVPAAGGAAWQVRAVNPANGEYELKFTIEDGSYKALNAALSPDGQWIAYRGRDNASVHLIKTDGSGARLLVDSVGVGTSGIAWTASGWLAMTVMTNDSGSVSVLLVDPASCTAYATPNFKGVLQGIVVK
jgi:WD40 repeat protein